MENMALIIAIFGLIMTVPLAIYFWLKLRNEPKTSTIWSVLLWNGLGAPFLFLGLLLLSLAPSGPARIAGWVALGLAAIAFIARTVLTGLSFGGGARRLFR